MEVHFEGVGVKTQIRKKNAPSFYSRPKMAYLLLSSKKAKHLINDNFRDETTKLHE